MTKPASPSANGKKPAVPLTRAMQLQLLERERLEDKLKAGTIMSVALGQIVAHPLAQRRFDQTHAEMIYAEFNPAFMGVPTLVVLPDRRLFCVDGIHRKWAALKFLDGDGTQEVECNVIPVETDAEAAQLFIMLNRHKAVSCLDKFLVRVVAHDPIANGVLAVLAKFGLAVGRNKSTTTILAADAVESVYRRQQGPVLLERTIRDLQSAWGDDPNTYEAPIIKGLAQLIVQYDGAVQDEELVRKIQKTLTPNKLQGRAKVYMEAMGVSKARGVAEVLRQEYNKGRKTERLED